ncbi:MAG: hypothetical protein ACOC1U_11410 [Spirochaetota bacterium]
MFTTNPDLLDHAAELLSRHTGVSWILGGAGSGKSTLCAELSREFSIPTYNMDEHIYGAYFARYRPDRHPANTAWAAAENGMQWLLDMTWDEFDAFNRAAAAEYLDLFAADVAETAPEQRLLVDGGLYHPALLAEVLPRERIASLAAPHVDSLAVWTGTSERLEMKGMMEQLRDPEHAWRTFLEFDRNITRTIAEEAAAIGSPVVLRSADDDVGRVAARVAAALSLGRQTNERGAAN